MKSERAAQAHRVGAVVQDDSEVGLTGGKQRGLDLRDVGVLGGRRTGHFVLRSNNDRSILGLAFIVISALLAVVATFSLLCLICAVDWADRLAL